MSIVCKWSVDGVQSQTTFSSLEEMERDPLYDSYNYIRMNKCGLTRLPVSLPSNLQILYFDENKIFDVPPLPKTLHSISGINNRISKFPSIEHCTELEDVNLSGNDIMEVNSVVPKNVKTLNVDFNKVSYINYDIIDPSVKISVSYNLLCALPPESHLRNVVCDHNDINMNAFIHHYPEFAQRRVNHTPLQRIPIIQKIQGTDSQSVHHSSIQTSANKSLDYVLQYIPKKTPVKNVVQQIIQAYRNSSIQAYRNSSIQKSRFRKFLGYISKPLCNMTVRIPPIQDWCNSNAIHSAHGVTYKTLLLQVWAIIQDHTHKDEMEAALFQELDESWGVCFTGRFTRTLNALTGFVEQVQVGIHSREQMGNQIIMAIQKNEDKEKAKEEVKKILVDFEIPEGEHDVWLNEI